MYKQHKITLLILTATFCISALFTATSGHSRSTFNSTWQNQYPNSISLENATPSGCQLCHADENGSDRNPHGLDLDDALPHNPTMTELTDALMDIEALNYRQRP